MSASERCFLGIGSNIGDRPANLQLAIDGLAGDPHITVIAVSSVYETTPVGGPPQDDFLNAVVEITTDYAPSELLNVVNGVEEQAHRVRDVHWGPRTLDIDILTYGTQVVHAPNLDIPHLRMNQRGFVLAPMYDLVPDMVDKPPAGWEGVRRMPITLRVP